MLIAAVVAAAAFGAEGGPPARAYDGRRDLRHAAGAALAAAAIVLAPLRSRFWGGLTLAALIALAAWTAASITWSIEPSDSWIEANRTLSYVAVFAGGLALVRLFAYWSSVLGGVLLGCTVVCAYGLLTKVFPGRSPPMVLFAAS